MTHGLKSWQVGEVRVTRVLENALPLPPDGLIAAGPEGLAAHADWLRPHFVTDAGEIILSIHALVVESRGKTIVVDTCMGNDRPLPLGMGTLQTDFLDELEQVAQRTEVDVVLCTHLHFDHIGWNTMCVDGEYVPTFPNARYLMTREEYAHWSETDEEHASIDLRFGVEPIVAAGLHDLVETDHVVTDEVRLVPTPGHTPGHVSVEIASQGARAMITGDIAHHPVQLAEPGWGSRPDLDPVLAERTRRGFVADALDRDVLVIGTHFSDPTAGHLRTVDGKVRFEGA